MTVLSISSHINRKKWGLDTPLEWKALYHGKKKMALDLYLEDNLVASQLNLWYIIYFLGDLGQVA